MATGPSRIHPQVGTNHRLTVMMRKVFPKMVTILGKTFLMPVHRFRSCGIRCSKQRTCIYRCSPTRAWAACRETRAPWSAKAS